VGKQYVELRDGGYWIAGTRVSLDSVVYAFREGVAPEVIATERFPVLTVAQVFGAIAYYLAHREKIDEYLSQEEAEYEAFRARTNQADSYLSKKLAAARRHKQSHDR
jgi:uncharacterized protein (DUF433 family)